MALFVAGGGVLVALTLLVFESEPEMDPDGGDAEDGVAPRGTRVEHYEAIATFYGLRLLEDLQAPNVPEFVIYHSARRAAHYALSAIKMREKPRRRSTRAPHNLSTSWPAVTTSVPSPA